MDNYNALLEADWELIMDFLPDGWQEKARELGAYQRKRKFQHIGTLLRTLLLHLVSGCSMRETVVRAKYGGYGDITDVAFLKRLRLASD